MPATKTPAAAINADGTFGTCKRFCISTETRINGRVVFVVRDAETPTEDGRPGIIASNGDRDAVIAAAFAHEAEVAADKAEFDAARKARRAAA